MSVLGEAVGGGGGGGAGVKQNMTKGLSGPTGWLFSGIIYVVIGTFSAAVMKEGGGLLAGR